MFLFCDASSSSSEAWIAFAGVIVGSIVSVGFTWFVEWRKSKSDEKIYLKRKQEEAYLNILMILTKLNYSDMKNSGKLLNLTDFNKKLIPYLPSIKLYLPKDVSCELDNMIYTTPEQGKKILEKLVDIIKTRLGIPLN